MVSDRAVEMLRPVVQALVTPDDLMRARAVDAAISPGGDVITEAIAEETLWQRLTWYVATPATGTNVAAAFRMPNGGIARLITAYAKTAPSGGNLTAAVACTGWASAEAITVIAGNNASQPSRMVREVDPGALVTLNVTNVAGASGVTIELFYAPLRSQ